MAPDPPALKLRRPLDSPLLLVGGPNCLQILVDQFKPLLARRLEAGDEVGQRVESLPWEVGGKLAISHSRGEKTCSNAISSTGVRRRPPVRGMNRVSTNSARMIPCYRLKRRLGRSACDSTSLTRGCGYCGTVDEPNESCREVPYVKIRSGDLRG